jgi:hypothetical protein
MKILCACITSALIATALTGCNKHVKHKQITHDLTPELHGIAMRKSDAHNGFAITSNSNLRLLSDDLARTFYTSTPTRLTPYPIVNNSGQPW